MAKKSPASEEKAARTTALERALADGACTASSLLRNTAVIPSGIFGLDWLLLRAGGIPPGRFAEFYGAESGGKSLLLYRFCGHAQRMFPDRLATIFDTEASLYDAQGLSWARRHGIDLDRLPMWIRGDASIQVIFSAIERLVKSGDYSFIGLDSLAECYTDDIADANNERGYGDKRRVGADARAVTEFMKRICGLAVQNSVTMIFVNQLREKPNEGRSSFMGGGGTTTPGGRALRHSMALRLDVTPAGDITFGKREEGKPLPPVIGTQSNLYVAKCKFAPRGGRTGVDTGGPMRVIYNASDPIDELSDIVFAAKQFGLLSEAGGGWFTLGDKKVQGFANLAGYLRQDNNLAMLRGACVERLQAAASGILANQGKYEGDEGDESGWSAPTTVG